MEQVGTEANVLPAACSGVLVLNEAGFDHQGIGVELLTYVVFTRTYIPGLSRVDKPGLNVSVSHGIT